MMKNGFTRKKVSSLTLGEKLKKLRSEGRISLSEVSKNTKIQIKYLEYLENGEYEKLPASVYVKGFLRSYANYLGVNENYLVRLYDRERGIKENIKKSTNQESTSKPLKFTNFVVTPKIIFVSLAILLAFGCFFYLYRGLNTFIAAPRLIVYSPKDGELIKNSVAEIRGIAEKESEVSINSQETLVNEKGEFSERVDLQSGLNTITIKAKNKFGKETEKKIVLEAEISEPSLNNKSSESPVPEKEEFSGVNLDIFVQPAATWILVETDDEVAFNGELAPGETKNFKAREKIKVTSGKGNSTYVKVNGVDKGALSESPGVAKDVEFLREN